VPAREWKAGCLKWEQDVDNPQARQQRERVLKNIATHDCKKSPRAQLVRVWHKDLFEGLVPHSDYLGNFRNLDKTPWCLEGYDVRVGDTRGAPHEHVLKALQAYFKEFRSNVKELDQTWQELGDKYSVDDIDQVVELAARAHGEWVRIHPFANGNGRTARLWANYVFCRYGLGPVVIVRPRPNQPYGIFARQSMKYGNHEPMKQLFWEMLINSYQESADVMPLC